MKEDFFHHLVLLQSYFGRIPDRNSWQNPGGTSRHPLEHCKAEGPAVLSGVDMGLQEGGDRFSSGRTWVSQWDGHRVPGGTDTFPSGVDMDFQEGGT